MPEARVGDLTIAYELVGSGAPVVLTPGGRFDMDTAGVRELAAGIADRGFQVLLWDRPNCGRSSASFAAESESVLWADALAGLVDVLDVGPVALAGGSAGSRVALLAAARHPDSVTAMYLWWISGGTFGLMSLGMHYVGDILITAERYGMEGVIRRRPWRELVERNPDNRERILAMEPQSFISTMHSWIDHYIPSPESPVPGMSAADFASITVPVRIVRSGSTDLHHPPRTSEWVHELIHGSQLAEPPWGDDEWNERGDALAEGASLFVRWPLLAPDIASFLGTVANPAVGPVGRS